MPPDANVGRRMTAAEEILLGARDLVDHGRNEFSEWDLTVSAWKRSPNRFGCRGYESDYPDHKRVMMEIMGATKDNPLRKGWIQRIRPNFYAMTDLGKAEADRLLQGRDDQIVYHRSPQPIYDSIAPYVNHSVFKKYGSSSEELKMWLSAASFLGITRNDALHLEDRLRFAKSSVEGAKKWMADKNLLQITRGVTGGSTVITIADVDKVGSLISLIEERFSVQISALRKNK